VVYQPACLTVNSVSPAKTDELIEVPPFGEWIPHERGTFGGILHGTCPDLSAVDTINILDLIRKTAAPMRPLADIAAATSYPLLVSVTCAVPAWSARDWPARLRCCVQGR